MKDKKGCPGSTRIKTPELSMKKCPQCGNSIEIFSDELEAACPVCGLKVFNDDQLCIRWCRYAVECVGETRYRLLTGTRPDNSNAE